MNLLFVSNLIETYLICLSLTIAAHRVGKKIWINFTWIYIHPNILVQNFWVIFDGFKFSHNLVENFTKKFPINYLVRKLIEFRPFCSVLLIHILSYTIEKLQRFRHLQILILSIVYSKSKNEIYLFSLFFFRNKEVLFLILYIYI